MPQGLLLLSDLGTRRTWRSSMAGATSTGCTRMRWMRWCIMQTRGGEAARALPPYDRAAAPSRNGADAGVVLGRGTWTRARRPERAPCWTAFEFLSRRRSHSR